MEVGNVKDDNGHPFVTFSCWNDCQQTDWLAKKQLNPGVAEFLTHAERERLAMGISSAALRRRVRGQWAKRQTSAEGEERPGKHVSGVSHKHTSP